MIVHGALTSQSYVPARSMRPKRCRFNIVSMEISSNRCVFDVVSTRRWQCPLRQWVFIKLFVIFQTRIRDDSEFQTCRITTSCTFRGRNMCPNRNYSFSISRLNQNQLCLKRYEIYSFYSNQGLYLLRGILRVSSTPLSCRSMAGRTEKYGKEQQHAHFQKMLALPHLGLLFEKKEDIIMLQRAILDSGGKLTCK